MATKKTTNNKKSTKKQHKKADQYNDPKHNYLKYWQGRDYENAAEELAIRRLLKNKNFKKAVDIGSANVTFFANSSSKIQSRP